MPSQINTPPPDASLTATAQLKPKSWIESGTFTYAKWSSKN
ncbi:MAG: hypothetical protein AAF630_05270 [Cyanobacteria bacterium P01_C01_bin.38]